MTKPLRVLIVEDSADDAELMVAALTRAGFAVQATRVDARPELQAALASGEWDVVLSDCRMPALTAEQALSDVLATGKDLPVIILSGVVRPEDAVSLLKQGAHDFIGKETLSRLGPAVERELRETAGRAGRRVAEERLRTLSLAVEQSPVSVVITDRDGIIRYVNPRFEQVTGYPAEDALGRHLNFTGDDDSAADLWPTLRAGREWRGEVSGRRKDGSLIWERVSVSPLTDDHGAVIHFVAVKEDVTVQRMKERDLHGALEKLTESNTELERFAYIASHDLQEPLRTITLYAQLLERQFGGRLGGAADQYLEFMVGAARRMHTLINDLLAYSRITGKGTPFSLVQAGEACAAALASLQDSVREADAVIQVDPLPEVIADAVQLVQVFQNLVGNALKFRRPGIRPQIRISAGREDGAWVFSVADNGIGLEQSDQDVFEIFRRLHTSQAYPGTGIGLAICKRIVQHHNGRIWVTSTPGEGATFHFTLAGAEAGAGSA
ncbi:MAG: sensor histidine kinase [Solirubrobacterales bacterium]